MLFELFVIAIVSGSVAGGIFYGGLWWTVKRMVTHRMPPMWMFASFVLRSASVLLIFYAVIAVTDSLLCLAATLLVFFITRTLTILHIRPMERRQPYAVKS
ncbi:MAG: ATP synthase subunit I [Chloroflexota bacterium]